MRLLKKQCSFSDRKKTVVVVTGLSLLVFSFLYASLHRVYLPQISRYLTKTVDLMSDFNEQEFISNLPLEVMKAVVNKPTNPNLFISPYIIAPKLYNTNSTAKPTNSSRRQKVISCFNCPGWFIQDSPNQYNRDFKACPYRECTFDPGDRKSTADVVLFFVGMLGMTTVPERPAGQIWVKCYWESPAHYNYPTHYAPWKSAFNWTLNYRTDSDIFAPVNRLGWRNSQDLLPDSVYLEISKNKTRNVAWFVSNCHTQSRREIYVKEMQKYIDVDIYGGCGVKSCTRSEEKDCEKKLTSTYKFYLSFENSFCKDYVTEKLFRNIEYRSHIIPVVRGGFDYNKYIPNGIFVNSANFSSAKDLALYLKELGNDYGRYPRMLKEKDKYTTVNYIFDWCDFCEKLHTEKGAKVISDIREWSHKDACHEPVDI